MGESTLEAAISCILFIYKGRLACIIDLTRANLVLVRAYFTKELRVIYIFLVSLTMIHCWTKLLGLFGS